MIGTTLSNYYLTLILIRSRRWAHNLLVAQGRLYYSHALLNGTFYTEIGPSVRDVREEAWLTHGGVSAARVRLTSVHTSISNTPTLVAALVQDT